MLALALVRHLKPAAVERQSGKLHPRLWLVNGQESQAQV